MWWKDRHSARAKRQSEEVLGSDPWQSWLILLHKLHSIDLARIPAIVISCEADWNLRIPLVGMYNEVPFRCGATRWDISHSVGRTS